MDKANEVLGDEKNTEIENGEDRLITDRTEEEARSEIEEKLQVQVPTFFYLPDRMDFDSDRKSTRLNSSHASKSRMPSSA